MQPVGRATLIASAVVVAARVAAADPTSGVDAALFRSSYDTGGLYSLEGARLMPAHDLSFKVLMSYARAPLRMAIPGIGEGAGNTGKDTVLDYLVTIDMAFGMSLTDKLAIGLDVAAYRTFTGAGYGTRGTYAATGDTVRSTGLIALRPLSNIDESAHPSDSGAYLGDGLAGPLDARLGIKYALFAGEHLAVAAVGSVFLPFGADDMLLGDASFVFEPKLTAELRRDRVHRTRLLANVAARIRERTVLQSYDATIAAQTPADSKVIADVGSEVVAGVGGSLELSPRVVIGAEGQVFLPLPDALSFGDCTLYNGNSCSTLTKADYFAGAKHGDTTALFTGGVSVRATPDLTAEVLAGAGAFGERAEELRVTVGVVWSPQPPGTAPIDRGDRDGDGIPDSVDACPDEPEDKDGFQDDDGCPDPDNDGDGIPDSIDRCPNEPEDKDGFQDADGCPDPDNDNDGIPDAVDKCPDQPEDKDGFQDADGCPDDDNDNDGIPDARDKCPNDPETFNGFEDEDGCPDVRGTAGPEERADRIDTKGAPVAFVRGGTALTPAGKQLIAQVATVIKNRKLSIRVEVHVALDTRSTAAGQVAAAKRRGKQLAARRAQVVLEALIAAGAPAAALQAVGIGAERPLGTSNPADPVNERVDFIKSQQGAAP